MKQSKKKKVYYNKLVKDNVPEIIHAAGSKCEVRELSEEEFEKELFEKIKEEAGEVIAAKDNEELTREIGDLLDVIDEIMRLKGISRADVEARRAASLMKKGGFKKRLYLVWSSDEDGYASRK